MAISIYEPRDARNALREVTNSVMDHIYHALEGCGGECDLRRPVAMLDGDDAVLVERVFIEEQDDAVYYCDEDGNEDNLLILEGLRGLCDIWQQIK